MAPARTSRGGDRLNRLSHLLEPVPPAPGWSVSRRVLVWSLVLAALAGSLGLLWASYRQSRADLRALIEEAAGRHGLDVALVEGVVLAESSGNPRAVSRARAYGLMQLQLPTASETAGRPIGIEELFDPRLNLDLGCRYLNVLLRRYDRDMRLALMAYNAGPGRVDAWLRKTNGDVDEIARRVAFRETRRYVKTVLDYARR